MDFQFTGDRHGISVRCSMEHIALANWFNSEVRSNSAVFSTALSALQNLSPQQDVRLIGCEYTLFINADEVMVRANNLTIDGDDMPEPDFHYYDEESLACCGTDDFQRFLNAYFEFIHEPAR